MTFGELLSQSFDYAKKSVWGEWGRWVILFVLMIIQSITVFIVPLFNGYIFRIWQGSDPAPDVDQWKKLFVDGWRVNIVSIIYMIPVIIVAVLAMGPGLMQMISGSIMGDPTVAMAGLMGMGLGLMVVIIVTIIVEIFMLTGVVRFAKMDSIAEAFSFGEIAGHIKKIGWGHYIVALIILWIVMVIMSFIAGLFMIIPIIGWIIYLFLLVPIAIFAARYLVNLYGSA